jgi:hypothetical protein
MDRFDKSHSDGTYRIMRAEHLVVAIACTGLAIAHFHEIDVPRFAALFLVIDVVGYLPVSSPTCEAGRAPSRLSITACTT